MSINNPMNRVIKSILPWLGVLLLPGFCAADEYHVSIPLQDGRLSAGPLRDVLNDDFNVSPDLIGWVGDLDVPIDLRGVNGWVFVRGLNSALGDGFHFDVTDDELRITADPDKLPRDWDESCDALSRFTDVAAPDAIARQNRRFGLHLPQDVNPQKPLVILIHGLDGDCACCQDLAKLLREDNFQTAMFSYAAERPLKESAGLFTASMRDLHKQYPGLPISIVTESMGGLIARRYVEGSDYSGGVARLILIAPPNAGSGWTDLALVLKLGVNASRWWHDPQWSPAWMITEGIGQSARDLQPDSEFLAELNSFPRRDGIRYTIIAGERPLQYRFEARALGWSDNLITDGAARWWGFHQVKSAIESKKQSLLTRVGDSDGPVSLASAHLAGVDDFVAIPADHIALYQSVDGQKAASWPTIENRLSK